MVADAFGAASAARVAVLVSLNPRSPRSSGALAEHFDRHPDAEILRSLAGLGPVLGARVLGEFGDDPSRYADARGRKAYAGTAPITKASGRSLVVLARVARNRRLADACERWAFCSLTASPGARRYYDALRARGKTHSQATRQLANRWVGILHACLERREAYREEVAWPGGARSWPLDSLQPWDVLRGDQGGKSALGRADLHLTAPACAGDGLETPSALALQGRPHGTITTATPGRIGVRGACLRRSPPDLRVAGRSEGPRRPVGSHGSQGALPGRCPGRVVEA